MQHTLNGKDLEREEPVALKEENEIIPSLKEASCKLEHLQMASLCLICPQEVRAIPYSWCTLEASLNNGSNSETCGFELTKQMLILK